MNEAYDPNVVAYIYPAPGHTYEKSANAIKMNEPDDASIDQNEYHTIRFDKRPATEKGFIFGTHPTADFILPSPSFASSRHFALWFDIECHLIVRDLNSKHGTRVVYGDSSARDADDVTELDGKERQMEWNARGPSLTQGFHPIINIKDEICFRIVVPNHDVRDPEYRQKVAQFCQEPDPVKMMKGMDIDSCLPTAGATPAILGVQESQRPFWRKKIGEGTFGVVYYVWNVKTRDVFALKEPNPKAELDKEAWEREAHIMKDLTHPNIVRLIFHTMGVKGDKPQLGFEYAPGHSLWAYIPTSTSFQNKQVAVQLLDGLQFLHDRGMPIVHRDIKPGNVLVQSWTSSDVHVKFGDFGFAKKEELMQNSFVGTPGYCAPEVVIQHDDSIYDCQVDIWSLGALLLTMECHGLPNKSTRRQAGVDSTAMPRWAKFLISFGEKYAAQKKDTPVLDFALKYMLKIDPKDRSRARQCWEMAKREFKGQSTQDSADSGIIPSPGQNTSSDGSTVRATLGLGDGKALIRDLGSKYRDSNKSITPTPGPSTAIRYPRAVAGVCQAQNTTAEFKEHANFIASPPEHQARAAVEADPRSRRPHSPGSALRKAIVVDDLVEFNIANSDSRPERVRDITESGSIGLRKRERPENQTTVGDGCQGQSEAQSAMKRNRLH